MPPLLPTRAPLNEAKTQQAQAPRKFIICAILILSVVCCIFVAASHTAVDALQSQSRQPLGALQKDQKYYKRWKNAAWTRTFSGKQKRDTSTIGPIFYILYGAQGSGKSGILKKALLKVGLSNDNINGVIHISVDDVIAENEKFKNAKPAERWKMYKELRENGGDEINDEIMNEALTKKFDVALETTGWSVSWTRDQMEKVTKNGFQAIILYPLVPPNMLITRTQEREQATKQVAAKPEEIAETVRMSIANLFNIETAANAVTYAYDNSGAKDEEKLAFEEKAKRNIEGGGTSSVSVEIKCKCDVIGTMKDKFKASKDYMNLLMWKCPDCFQ